MKVLVIYAHSEPTSLTGALKNVGVSALMEAGHEVIVSDLYGAGFSPTAAKCDFSALTGQHYNYMFEQKAASANDLAFSPDIIEEIQQLKEADIVIIYTPIWWFSVPAILKGWFDRVLAMGTAWDGGKIYEEGLLKGKKAMVCALAGGPEEYYQPLGKHKATMRQILHPINHGTLAFCGMDVIEPFVVYSSLSKTNDQYKELLKSHEEYIKKTLEHPRYLSKY